MADIGPHLLGRKPYEPDARDFRLENFVGLGTAQTDADLVQTALTELKQTTVGYKKWAATSYADVTQTHWWKALNALVQIAPTPPPPPTGLVRWQNPEPVLDQGNYGTCVGNGVAQFGNTLPIDDKFVEADARAIYYEATVLDGSPDDPNAPGGGQQGATVRSGMQAYKNRGRISGYAFSVDLATLKKWVLTKGPLVIGSDWMNDMFNPDANGFVTPTGGVAGGHCWIIDEYDPANDVWGASNSWGKSWGVDGRFYLKGADFQYLLDQQGEAYTAVELAL